MLGDTNRGTFLNYNQTLHAKFPKVVGFGVIDVSGHFMHSTR